MRRLCASRTLWLASLGRPIIPDPTRQAFFADFAGCERKDHGCRLRGFRVERNAVLEQKAHHSHESDTLVAINEGMIFSEAEGIGRGQFGKSRALIEKLVDRSL